MAPQVEGKANQKLIEFLVKALDLAKSDITVKSGKNRKT